MGATGSSRREVEGSMKELGRTPMGSSTCPPDLDEVGRGTGEQDISLVNKRKAASDTRS